MTGLTAQINDHVINAKARDVSDWAPQGELLSKGGQQEIDTLVQCQLLKQPSQSVVGDVL